LCVRKPYFDDLDAVVAEIRELRLRNAVAEHRAWVSVDLMHVYDAKRLRDPNRHIGKLLAALATGDTTAVVWPEKKQIREWDRNVMSKLRADDPLEAFTAVPEKVPVIQISEDDPRMEAAVAEARRRWPEFVKAFALRQPGQMFAVKVPIRDDEGHVEFMWVKVTRLENDTIHGKVNNEPVAVKSVRMGSKVAANREDLNDWLFTDGDKMVGGFTANVLEEMG
jgi:uncharacterized protein YegJ (DUF2314 family)